MKRSQIKAIFANQQERNNTIIHYSILIVSTFILLLSFLVISLNQNKNAYTTYKENSNIDYQVYLKENDYYEESYLGKDNSYIASLINYINSNFNYELKIEGEYSEYKYKYRLEAETIVKNKNESIPLYKRKDILVPEKEYKTTKDKINIKENYRIDYNYYNNLIKKFIEIYGLDDIDSTLKINLYVNIYNDCESNSSIKESIVTLNIPLTTKTVKIDVTANVPKVDDLILKCGNNQNKLLKILSIILIIILISLIVSLINYIMHTNTPESLYTKELKKILNNYGSYIQKTTSEFNFKKYEIIKIEIFDDMLEIRDTISAPILMVENKAKNSAYFMIPSPSKILYVYTLNIEKVKQKKENNEKEI